MRSSPPRRSLSFTAPFLRLSGGRKKRFLIMLMHDMTIALRSFYGADRQRSAALFEEWNELQHRLAGNLEMMLAGSDARYPDEVLAELIEEAAEEGLGEAIRWAWQSASDRLSRSENESAPPRSAAPAI